MTMCITHGHVSLVIGMLFVHLVAEITDILRGTRGMAFSPLLTGSHLAVIIVTVFFLWFFFALHSSLSCVPCIRLVSARKNERNFAAYFYYFYR